MACDSLYFLPSEIARLVLGYLQAEGYSKTYKNFIKECPHLSEYVSFMKKGQYYPLTINGLALLQILEEYGSLRVAESTRKLTPNPALNSLWCQFDSVVDNIKKRVASNSNLAYKGNEKQGSRTRMQMAQRRRNQIKTSVINVDPDVIQPHNSRTTVTPLVITQKNPVDKDESDYSMSQSASPSDVGEGGDGNDSDVYEMSVDETSGTEKTEIPTSQSATGIPSDCNHNSALLSPRPANQNSVDKNNPSECSTINTITESTATDTPVVLTSPAMMACTTEAASVGREITDIPGSPAASIGIVPSLKTPVKHNTTLEPAMEKSPRRKRPPKRKPQGDHRRQNKSDTSATQGVSSQNESSNSTDGSALENSFPQILEHIMNDPLLPHKLAENINKSLHPEVIPDPGTPAALPPVDVVPESPFMGRSLEDILDQQETQMPASSINGIIELTEKDPNFEWLFSAGVSYLDEATHDRDFTDNKNRSNALQTSTRNNTKPIQSGSSGCNEDSAPEAGMSFGGVTSENIPFTHSPSFMPISEDPESNLFKLPAEPNFANTSTSNVESFHNLTQCTTNAVQFPDTSSINSSSLQQQSLTDLGVAAQVTANDIASQQFATSAVQSVTMCVTAQPLASVVTSHQPITSRPSSQPFTTAVTSVKPITSSFSSDISEGRVESTVTSPHGFPVLSLRSSVCDDDLPDPLSSFTIQSPVKPCVSSQCHTSEGTSSVSSASYSLFVSGMNGGQHSSTPTTVRSNTLALPCMTSIATSVDFTKLSSIAQTTSQMVFSRPNSSVQSISPRSLPTINIRSLMDKLEAKAKGEIVEIDLQPNPAPKPSTKCRGRKKNPLPKKSSPKRVQPKPLSPSGGGSWSSELSALVKIASPEKSSSQVTQRSIIKRSCVTRSSSIKTTDVNSDQTVLQTRPRKTKTKKANETLMAVLSPSGSSVHHVPVLEVNSLSEVPDAKDLVPMGDLVPTHLPVLSSSHVTTAITQNSVTSQSNMSSSPVIVTSSCLPFVQTDAPQTPPTTTIHTEFPSMPDICGGQPSLPVPANTCDNSKDTQLDHASVLNDAYSADRDFLESPNPDAAGCSGDGSADHGMETGMKSLNEDLNRYCGIPIDKLTQKDIHVRPLDFGSAIPNVSLTEVSPPIRQPSFGRGKKTPARSKKVIGRPPERRSTRGKLTTGENINNSPTASREIKPPSPQNVMTPTKTSISNDQFDSCPELTEDPSSQQKFDSPLQSKTLKGKSSNTPSCQAKNTLTVTPCRARDLCNEPEFTPFQDIDYSPAGTPSQLTICTPTRSEETATQGESSQRQILTLGNVGALSLQEVGKSPSYYDDMVNQDCVSSHQVPLLFNSEQNSHNPPTGSNENISELKDHCENVAKEIQEKIQNSQSVLGSAQEVAESEISSAVFSIQDTVTSREISNTMENRDTIVPVIKPSSSIPEYTPSQVTHEEDSGGHQSNNDNRQLQTQIDHQSDSQTDHQSNTDNQQLQSQTEVKDKNEESVSKDAICDRQSGISIQKVTNSNLNTYNTINTHQAADVSNQLDHQDVNQSHGHVINQSQDIDQSQDYQNVESVSHSKGSSTNILEDALKQVFSTPDSQQTVFSPAPVVPGTQGTQFVISSPANRQPASCKGPTPQVLSSTTPAVSQNALIVYSPAPVQTRLPIVASTPIVHSAASVSTHFVKSPAPVMTPATFIVTSPTYPVIVNSPAPILSQSQFVLNSPVTPLMVKSPATPLIVHSPATPQIVHSPAAVMSTAPYKSVCSPAQHKVPSRAPTPQMEPADFIPDRSGTIYVTPNVLAQMSCEKGLVVQQERAVTTTSLMPCPGTSSAVDNGDVIQRPEVDQSPHGQCQSDQDIFTETTDDEVAEPTPGPSKLPTITEVSHDIAKIPSLFDTMDGHNQVVTQSENTSPHYSKDRHSPRYFSALSNSNDTPVCDPSSTEDTCPSSTNTADLQNDPDDSTKVVTVNKDFQQSDSDEDIDILGDWDHDLSAGERVMVTEHTISHESTPLSSDSNSPSKKSAWQAGFATKPSSTTSAFIRKILEQKSTRQNLEKKSAECAEKVSLKTQTTTQKITKNSETSVTVSPENRPGVGNQKEKAPRRVQVITLSKEVSKGSKDSQNALQSARGPFKHPQEFTPRKISHTSSKLSSHVKHLVGKDMGSGGEHSVEKDVSSHQHYVTPPKKRFTASLKSGDGLYFVSETQGSLSTDKHSHEKDRHNFSAKTSHSEPSPRRNRKSTMIPRKDLDVIHKTSTSLHRPDESLTRAPYNHNTSERTSQSPHRKSSEKTLQSHSHRKSSQKTSQSHSRHKTSDRMSQSPSHHKTKERSSPSPSPHRTNFIKSTESPSRYSSQNLERVNASPGIRRKVFETSVDKERLGKSKEKTAHECVDYEKSMERDRTSSSLERSNSSSAFCRTPATDMTQSQPSPKRGHKRRESSCPVGEVKSKRTKKSNKPIDLTKLDVDRFLNSDVYIKGILEK
ncbi:mucin-17-like [Ylistrum balloti]|uniref:mucin-17-like n=1 Tax=Ylistrum balloti TaxID=509963 RepID=UPI00290581A8|nr:mucin-17-like [Ylistrum balloti]